jgi:hypothetical protein
MNNLASNYYTRSSTKPGGRGTVLALCVALVIAAGTAGAGLAPDSQSTADSGATSVARSAR